MIKTVPLNQKVTTFDNAFPSLAESICLCDMSGLHLIRMVPGLLITKYFIDISPVENKYWLVPLKSLNFKTKRFKRHFDSKKGGDLIILEPHSSRIKSQCEKGFGKIGSK